MEWVFSAYSHPGKIRKSNEDYFYVPTETAAVKNLVMVADGMGGHNAGEVASRMVVESILEYYGSNNENITSLEQAKDLLMRSIQHANELVYRQSKAFVEYEGMGTTLTLAYFYDNRACIGHVGDSCAYLIRDRDVKKITRDHSLVQELLENGSITQDEVNSHPQKNVITRALGTGNVVDVDYYEIVLQDNDILLLCTDGLVNHVDLSDNVDLFYSLESLDEITLALGKKALDDGGIDNVTVVLAKYSCTAGKR
ncbi:MAG: Stp1/IreP family PP2C-type Ser/Thr phosphatase [Clostridiales bacterium]|jgi:protein phosphatase|nr:Stp1/IreP family PP2C-type Ser/Thr phosphatase [Clostridiales bacterium]